MANKDPLDEAVEFVEALNPSADIHVDRRIIRKELEAAGRKYSDLEYEIFIEKLKLFSLAAYDKHTNIIGFFNLLKSNFKEILTSINHEYMHAVLYNIGEEGASTDLDKKHGTIEDIMEYGV